MIGTTRRGTRGSADLRGRVAACVSAFRPSGSPPSVALFLETAFNAAGKRREGRSFPAVSIAYARNARVRRGATHKLNAFCCKACKTVLDHDIKGGRMEDREREGISGLQHGSARLLEVETRFGNASNFGGLTHELSLGG